MFAQLIAWFWFTRRRIKTGPEFVSPQQTMNKNYGEAVPSKLNAPIEFCQNSFDFARNCRRAHRRDIYSCQNRNFGAIFHNGISWKSSSSHHSDTGSKIVPHAFSGCFLYPRSKINNVNWGKRNFYPGRLLKYRFYISSIHSVLPQKMGPNQINKFQLTQVSFSNNRFSSSRTKYSIQISALTGDKLIRSHNSGAHPKVVTRTLR